MFAQNVCSKEYSKIKQTIFEVISIKIHKFIDFDQVCFTDYNTTDSFQSMEKGGSTTINIYFTS